MAKQSLTSLWLEENDPKYRKVPGVGMGGEHAKKVGSRSKRIRRGKMSREGFQSRESILSFVERHRGVVEHDCIFVPGAQKGVPAGVEFCGHVISASRYMTLLTHGTPKREGDVSRHLCGNGHLSCINPSHLIWGSVGDNATDAHKHRSVGDNVQDRIHAID
ncbi:hypothetical protein [Sulfitobacter sp. PM12]|uniref:hypothetical protein n=1 Tax=Sulfitobacter sp. PM12 TaxID=3138497 RepID=UPI00388F33EE